MYENVYGKTPPRFVTVPLDVDRPCFLTGSKVEWWGHWEVQTGKNIEVLNAWHKKGISDILHLKYEKFISFNIHKCYL